MQALGEADELGGRTASDRRKRVTLPGATPGSHRDNGAYRGIERRSSRVQSSAEQLKTSLLVVACPSRLGIGPLHNRRAVGGDSSYAATT
jgi:hypothetical protein